MKANKRNANRTARRQRRRLAVQRRRMVPRTMRRSINRSRPRTIHDSHAAFRVAICNPFSPHAIGCRVPDSYSFPTVCYHVNGTIQCTPDANGNFEAALLPTPCHTIILGRGGATGFGGFANNTFSGYLTSPNQLWGELTNFRVVAWGVRIITKDVMTNLKGRVYAAVIPAPRSGVNWAFMNNIPSTSPAVFSQNVIQYSVGGTTPSAIQSLSTCTMFSMQDLLEQGSRMISVSPSHSAQYEFRGAYELSVGNQWSNAVIAGDSGGNTVAGGNITNLTFHDPVNLAGGSVLLIYVSGMQNNGPNEFDLDVVYHLEGTPNISVANVGAGGVTSSTLAPSAQDVVVGSTQQVENDLSAARNSGLSDYFRPDGMGLGQQAYQLASNIGSTIYSAASTPLGRRIMRGGIDMYLSGVRSQASRSPAYIQSRG